MVRRLYEEFNRQMDSDLDLDKDQQEIQFAKGNRFIGVLDRHIMGNTQPVVFTMEAVNSDFLLRFFLPLYAGEYKKLVKSNYVPPLRSRQYLAVGFGEQKGIRYAYSAVKMPPHRGAYGMINALERLGRELERFVAIGGP
jgi:hypothetical protein